VGGSADLRLARVATYVSIAALAPCPVCLILDLGRPARFQNMLRTFRPTSRMSMGTWVLTAFGILIAFSAGGQFLFDRASDRSPKRRQLVSSILKAGAPLVALFGFGVAGYTGVLLAATAVPLWCKRPWLLGPLFLSSAMASGAATVTAVLSIVGPPPSSEGVHQLESVAAVAEAALLGAWVAGLGSTARAITDGQTGFVLRAGAIGTGLIASSVVSLVTARLPRRHRRTASFLGAALSLVGVLALRYSIVEGGRISADDPAATFDLTG
jgi:formate-dependent nitrite reductase membrane component NrfD